MSTLDIQTDADLRRAVESGKLDGRHVLDLSYTAVSDLSPIAGLKKLLWLSLTGTAVSDLTPIANLHKLEFLYLDKTPVSDLTPLAGLQKLTFLDVSGTNVSDLSPVYGLENLKLLYPNDTPIPVLAQHHYDQLRAQGGFIIAGFRLFRTLDDALAYLDPNKHWKPKKAALFSEALRKHFGETA